MKKVIIISSLVLFCWIVSVPLARAGQYDGLWLVPALPGDLFFVRHDFGVIVVVRLTGSFWEGYVGRMTDNTAVVANAAKSDFLLPAEVTARINFISSNSATIIILSCTPEQNCQLPSGAVALKLKKFFNILSERTEGV